MTPHSAHVRVVQLAREIALWHRADSSERHTICRALLTIVRDLVDALEAEEAHCAVALERDLGSASS